MVLAYGPTIGQAQKIAGSDWLLSASFFEAFAWGGSVGGVLSKLGSIVFAQACNHGVFHAYMALEDRSEGLSLRFCYVRLSNFLSCVFLYR